MKKVRDLLEEQSRNQQQPSLKPKSNATSSILERLEEAAGENM